MDQIAANPLIDEPTIEPAAVQRERTDTLGLAIEEALDEAERELAEIRRIGIPGTLAR